MIMATRRQSNIACPIRKHPSKLRNKRDEMRFEIPLQMRQVAPIELHIQILPLRAATTREKMRPAPNTFPPRESRRGGRIRPPREQSERFRYKTTRANAKPHPRRMRPGLRVPPPNPPFPVQKPVSAQNLIDPAPTSVIRFANHVVGCPAACESASDRGEFYEVSPVVRSPSCLYTGPIRFLLERQRTGHRPARRHSPAVHPQRAQHVYGYHGRRGPRALPLARRHRIRPTGFSPRELFSRTPRFSQGSRPLLG